MSSSRYSPTDSGYWSSPRLKKTNLDLNHNVGDSLKTAQGIKSLSEPSSPQLWHKGTCRMQQTSEIRINKFVQSCTLLTINKEYSVAIEGVHGIRP